MKTSRSPVEIAATNVEALYKQAEGAEHLLKIVALSWINHDLSPQELLEMIAVLAEKFPAEFKNMTAVWGSLIHYLPKNQAERRKFVETQVNRA